MNQYNYKLIIEDTGDVYYYIEYKIAELNARIEMSKGHKVQLIPIL